MCLSLEMKRPNDVLEAGEFYGHEYRIISNGKGYLCGYVKVEKGHPWHGAHYFDFEYDDHSLDDIEVHGGITFASHDVPCEKEGDDAGYWLGFDCSHGGDAPDSKYVTGELGQKRDWWMDLMTFEGDTVKPIEYVRSECEGLAKQAASFLVPAQQPKPNQS